MARVTHGRPFRPPPTSARPRAARSGRPPEPMRVSAFGVRGSKTAYGHFTSGGIDDRIEVTLPPVFRPKMVPRS